MRKKDLIDILVKEYDVNIEQLNGKQKSELEIMLNKLRSNKNFLATENFWKIKGLPTPDASVSEAKKGTEKYAWLIFVAWVMMFVIFAVFIYLVITFL